MRRLRARVTVLVVVVAVLAASAGSASAHSRAPLVAPPRPAEPAAAPLVLVPPAAGAWVAGPAAGSWAFELGLVGLVLVLGAASARRPRLVALAVSLALGVFVVESATHAVHELRDPGHATHCSVLAAAEHAPSDAPAAPALLDAPAPSPWRAWLSPAPIRIDPAGRAARGRAPPSASV